MDRRGMSKEAMQNVPRGLVRSLTTRWQVNDDTGDVDDAQRPARAGRSTGVRPRRNLPQLHNGFFQEILGRVYGELEVAGFTLEQEHAGTPSQTSNIMSVQVLSTDHSHMHVILKSINFASPKARVLNFKELFKKEALMYSTVIPSLIAMHQDDPLTVFPISYYNSNDLIVLDDLASHGYRTGDHKAGLDAAHCKLVFAELGRFHARAYALKNSESTHAIDALDEVSREVQFTKERSSIYENDFAQLASSTIDIIRKSTKASRYAKQIEEILNNTYHHLLRFLKKSEVFSTLTHGDLWTNNILFSYSEEQPVSVKFLDFQTCRYGSPALDINYFLYTSTTETVRDRYMDDFMRTYHRSLVRTLRQLGLNSTMNLTDLRREVDSTSLYGFLAAHLILRDTFVDSDVEGDTDVFSKRIEEIVVDLGEQNVF